VLLVDKDKNGTYETASWDIKTDFDGDGKADWMEIVAIFKRYGFEWGGDWK
jgi:peptidoglycan L-alanyl-D-glutamate endopeptidase CwlK